MEPINKQFTVDKVILIMSSCLIPFLSLCLVGLGMWTEHQVYLQTTVPHTEFQEITTMLNWLDSENSRLAGWIASQTDIGADTQQLRTVHSETMRLRSQAMIELGNKNYNTARENISTALNRISEVLEPLPAVAAPAPTSPWIWIILPLVLIGLIIGIISGIFVGRRL